MEMEISPEQIQPLHIVQNQRLLAELSESMTEEGWNGRRLLVIKRDSAYFGWTGSHRIAAARLAHLQTVPCYVMDESTLPEGTTADYGHVMDYERLEAIRKTEDETAIYLMWQEGRL